MPAIMDDPASPTIYRTSGSAPFPDPHNTQPSLPADITPRQVTLRDRITIATIVPFSSRHQVPPSLLAYLSDQFAQEIEKGDTYPMIDPLPLEKFSAYWFQNFGAIMLLGTITSLSEVTEGRNWATDCLGSFYIKPNYPGRSSHVCNAGFLVTEAARNRGVGRLMGETYIDWAPKLGYTYSVFNLVYETNVASCRIWDALGFKRIGRVKGCGNLKSHPGKLIDALIYGRDLLVGADDLVSEARFDKIKFYLQHGAYPAGADRSEKSRLRSSAMHYKLLDDGRLMLKDKEVVADPAKQYEIAKDFHGAQHAGINKTTARISERFHWVRIKESVSLVIKNCPECKDALKPPPPPVTSPLQTTTHPNLPPPHHDDDDDDDDHPFHHQNLLPHLPPPPLHEDPFHDPTSPTTPFTHHPLHPPSYLRPHPHSRFPHQKRPRASLSSPSPSQSTQSHSEGEAEAEAEGEEEAEVDADADSDPGAYLPLDPAMMTEGVGQHLGSYGGQEFGVGHGQDEGMDLLVVDEGEEEEDGGDVVMGVGDGG